MVLKENPVYQHPFQAPQDLPGPLVMLAPEVHLVFLDLWEDVTLVFLDLTVNRELQELDFLDLLDLKEIKVFREQKDRLAVPGKGESLAFLESQASQEPRENQPWPGPDNQENQVFREKEAILGKMEKLASPGSQVSLGFPEKTGSMDLEETQGGLDHLEQKDPQGGALGDLRVSQDFQA